MVAHQIWLLTPLCWPHGTKLPNRQHQKVSGDETKLPQSALNILIFAAFCGHGLKQSAALKQGLAPRFCQKPGTCCKNLIYILIIFVKAK
jgi:hypothetical protein